MAISPMQLPSPKAYDPNQMEIANLNLLRDPYTVDGARLEAMMLSSNREANDQDYRHAVAAQQDYYNRALQAQSNESAMELIPKMLHEQHGIGIMSGIPEIRRVLENMPQGLYDQYVNQAFQGETSKAVQAGGAGIKSLLEAGHQVSPEQAYYGTGLRTSATTPLDIQKAQIHAASSGGDSSGLGGSSSIQLPPIQMPDGSWATPTYSPNKKANEEQWKADLIRKGLTKPGPNTTGLQPNQRGQPAQPSGQQPLPQQQPRGGTTQRAATPANRNAEWDAVKKTMPPKMVEDVERVRKLNKGNVFIDEQRRVIVGNNAQGQRVEYPIR